MAKEIMNEVLAWVAGFHRVHLVIDVTPYPDLASTWYRSPSTSPCLRRVVLLKAHMLAVAPFQFPQAHQSD